jgi:hypothetical protein
MRETKKLRLKRPCTFMDQKTGKRYRDRGGQAHEIRKERASELLEEWPDVWEETA